MTDTILPKRQYLEIIEQQSLINEKLGMRLDPTRDVRYVSIRNISRIVVLDYGDGTTIDWRTFTRVDAGSWTDEDDFTYTDENLVTILNDTPREDVRILSMTSGPYSSLMNRSILGSYAPVVYTADTE